MIIPSTVNPVLKIGLQFLGIWPGVSYAAVQWLSYVSSILIVQYFQYLYIFEHLKISELSNLIDALTITLDESLTLLKLIGLWMHRRVFHQILNDMDNDWRESINIEQHLYIMRIKSNISYFFSNAMLSTIEIATVIYLLGDYIIGFIFLNEDYNVTLWELPIKIQFPFETQQSPTFEFLVISILLHVMLHVYMLCMINGLIITLVLHVSGQIDIMCHEIKNISKNVLHKPTMSLFGMLIEKHNRIISFSNNIEKLFSFIALMQVVWNTLVICCLGFFIILLFYNETGIFVLMKTIVAYLAIMVDAFIICFAGEHLSFKGKSITNAIYEMLWYEMPAGQNKIIIFIIMRSQKRLTITAGKMMDMSFEIYMSIMKASVSYISVLNAMY